MNSKNRKTRKCAILGKSALSILLMPLCLSGFAGETAPDGYRLVWADEFEVDGKPDPAKWTYEQGFVRNKELQWYQPENAVCKDGKLIIEGRRERRENPTFKEGSENWKEKRPFIDYTSACLITKGLQSWQFGRFEVKARFKTEEGLWPAIWFLGVEGKWPDKGEIDLMEYFQDTLLANAFWCSEEGHNPKGDVTKTPMESFNDPEWDEKFHVWRMEWDSEKIELYVDDRLLNTIDLSQTINPTTDWGPKNPFHQPHYILLNLAIGSNGGDPSGTDFPTRFEIDYVRVYQKTEAKEEQ